MIRWRGDKPRAAALRPRSGVVSSPQAHSELWFIYFYQPLWIELIWKQMLTIYVSNSSPVNQPGCWQNYSRWEDIEENWWRWYLSMNALSSHSRSLWFLSSASSFEQCIAACHFVQSWPREPSNWLKVDIWGKSNIWAQVTQTERNQSKSVQQVIGVKQGFC